MSPGGRIPPDPSQASRFTITIDGVEIAVFSELVGITSGLDPTALTLARDQRRRLTLKKLPGKRTPPTVTLKRGLTRNLEIWAWHEDAVDRAAARRDATLVAFNTAGEPVVRFDLAAAWPALIEIGAVQAGASQLLLETVTIVALELRRVSV
jgi:phage tail-like protein